MDLLKLQQGGAADYLFWPGVRGPGCLTRPVSMSRAVMKSVRGWPFRTGLGGRCSPCSSMWRSLWADGLGSVTLLNYREAARDAETFSALTGPQRERHLKLLRKRYLQKVQYCSILEVIQYLKTGR